VGKHGTQTKLAVAGQRKESRLNRNQVNQETGYPEGLNEVMQGSGYRKV
jgi:hypothetical protein